MKNNLKEYFDEFRERDREDREYIIEFVKQNLGVILKNKFYIGFLLTIKKIISAVIILIFAGLWAGSIMALLLANTYLLFVIVLILLCISIVMYVKLFTDRKVEDECKRFDQFVMGIRPIRKSKLN